MDPAGAEPYVAELRGEVDLSVAAALSRLAGEFENGPSRAARVDLRTVTFLDSSGLGFLARLVRAADERGGTVTVVGPSAAVQRLLAVSGLLPLLVVEA